MSWSPDPPTSPITAPSGPHRGRRWGAVAGVVVVVLGGIGIGVAVANTTATTDDKPAPPAAASAAAPNPGHSGAQHSGAQHSGAQHSGARHSGARHAGKAVDPARQSWAHQYGVDRATMPHLAPVAAASPAQQAAATDLLVRTEAATAQYANLDVARAAGFDLQASLARHEQQKGPGLARQMQRVDSGTAAPGTPMPMLHVGNPANRKDGKVLDPSAPETLMYGYQGHGSWMLMGVMYTANESYPQAPPDPGGPITRWHYHDKSGGQALMMHVFFVPGNDLAHAYAADMRG